MTPLKNKISKIYVYGELASHIIKGALKSGFPTENTMHGTRKEIAEKEDSLDLSWIRDEDAEELIVLAAEKKRILMVGHLLQYHPRHHALASQYKWLTVALQARARPWCN